MRKYRIRATAIIAATLMVVSLSPLGESVASAAVPTSSPSGLTPDGGFVGGNPQLSWDALDGAARYRVQISDQSNFSNLLTNQITYNTTYTHRDELPVGDIYWRVAGMDSSGSANGPWATADVEKGLAAPNALTPADNATVDYATDPTSFAWTPTPTTKSYVLEIDDDDLFVGAARYVTRSTAYTPSDPLAAGKTYYWRVRGSSATNGTGVLTNWSEPRSFQQEWSSLATLIIPTSGGTQTDVELAWEPVPGARYYNIQVDTSQEFNDPMALKVTNGRNTRVTYPESLDNASYWWRVQAIDSDGNLGPWTLPRLFNRNWIAKPALLSPAANANSTGPLRFQWSAVDHAARYILEVTGSGTTKSCTTVQTSVYAEDCGFSSVLSGPFSWRVRAIDDPAGILGIWSDYRSHNSYTPEASLAGTINPSVPVVRELPATRTGTCLTDPAANENANCTFNSTPTFKWTRMAGATGYTLRIALDPNFTTVVVSESFGTQTSFVPTYELPDTDAGQAYYWHVQACGTGGCTQSPLGQSPAVPSSTFMKVSTRVKLLAPVDGSVVPDAPRFSWEDYLATTSSDAADPAPGTTDVAAREYQIQVSDVPTFATRLDDRTVDQTFYTAWDRTYPEGPLYWRVRARDGSKNWLAWSYGTSASDPTVPAFFTKRSPTPVPLAPTGTVVGASTLRWSRVSGATSYQFEVYKNGDKGFSTANKVATVATEQVEHTLSPSLPPDTYTWRVRRRDADNRYGAWSHEPNAVGVPLFTVAGAVPTLVSPANNAVTSSSNLVFSWNQVPTAASYRFQLSTSANFVTGVKSYDTVMSSFAPYDKVNLGTYWWRVIAQDSSNNELGTSAVRKLVKDIQPNAPRNVTASRGNASATVRWTAPLPTVPAGSPITGYVVYPYIGTTQQAPRLAPAGATSLLVSGLTNGTEYTFRVAAAQAGGPGPLSAKSNAVTPAEGPSLPPGAVYVPVTPCRVVDTRAKGGAFAQNTSRTYQVAGTGSAFNNQGGNTAGCGIPQGAQAVELSVTAVGPAGNGFFRAWPAGQAVPGATFLNYTRGQNVTNTGAVKLANGPTAQLSVRNYSSSSHYVLDVQGYYVDGSSGPVANGTVYVPITPCRIVDTRSGGGAFPSNTQRDFAVTGTGSAFASQGGKANGCGIPTGAGAIEGSVTAVSPASNGFFRAWPAGQSAPAATFLNYTRGQGITNTGAIKIATSGTRQLTARNYSGSAHYVIDVQGYFIDADTAPVPPGSVYVPITPCRIVDTRSGGGAFAQNTTRSYAVTGTGSVFASQGGKANGCGIPAGATAIEASVTAVDPRGNGFFRAWPSGQAVPGATFLNYTTNRGITNTGAIKIADSGTKPLSVRNYSATTHYVIDIQGYFLT